MLFLTYSNNIRITCCHCRPSDFPPLRFSFFTSFFGPLPHDFSSSYMIFLLFTGFHPSVPRPFLFAFFSFLFLDVFQFHASCFQDFAAPLSKSGVKENQFKAKMKKKRMKESDWAEVWKLAQSIFYKYHEILFL